MTVRLGSNITAQFLRQQFGRAAEDLSTATQRLASGQRIARPSDDPVGITIAEKLRTDTRVYTQGVRNLNDGISALSIAEGAMNELSEILNRIDELAKQSQNGTATQAQRNVMQQEVTALQGEWNRIVESTKHNGAQLLTGNDTRLVLQGSEGAVGTLAVQFGEEQLAGGIAGYAGATTRVGTDSAGGQLSQSNDVRAISADGRFVGFNNYSGQADVKDTLTGVTTRISTDSSGVEGSGSSVLSAISADGRFVAFSSGASNLVAGDTNGRSDAFVKDMLTGVTTRVSTDRAGGQGNFGSYAAAISADGRFVAFNSFASNLVAGDANGTWDAFVKDMLTGVTTRINTDSNGLQANDSSSVDAISADGRFVAFSSYASNLVAGDTNGVLDAFVKDTLTGVTTRVSTDSDGVQANNRSYGSFISADGRFVAFNSSASNLVAGDTNGTRDAFVKDTLTGVTIRVSTDSVGVQATANSSASAISADGRFVAFDTYASNLVAGDTNGWSDVFLKDTLTGVTTRISTDNAGGQGNSGSYAAVMSADGRFVSFNSQASNLVAGDTNNTRDGFVKDLTRTGVQQLSGLIVSNRVSAGVAQMLTARARKELTEYRTNLGISLARIDSFVSTLNSTTINLQEATGRIRDADIAQEASRAVTARIRQEVTVNLLKQANLQPSMALLLLKG